MINSHNVYARLAHQPEIDIHLFRPAEIISIRVRFNGRYVTPLTKNFVLPSKKNFALGRIREVVGVIILSVLSCH